MTSARFYWCPVCKNIVGLIHGDGAHLQCCGKPMEEMKANTTDAAVEKHVPVVKRTENGIRVSVGSTMHPMTEEHSIEWIYVASDDRGCRVQLTPGKPPVADFPGVKEPIEVFAYCNLHGLWKA